MTFHNIFTQVDLSLFSSRALSENLDTPQTVLKLDAYIVITGQAGL